MLRNRLQERTDFDKIGVGHRPKVIRGKASPFQATRQYKYTFYCFGSTRLYDLQPTHTLNSLSLRGRGFFIYVPHFLNSKLPISHLHSLQKRRKIKNKRSKK